MNEMIAQELQQIRYDLIDELNKVIGFLQKADNIFCGTAYTDMQDACSDINTMLNGLKEGNSAVWNHIGWGFSEHGNLRKIAEMNNWGDAYRQIEKNIDELSAKYHIVEKSDSSLWVEGVTNGTYTDAKSYAGCPGKLSLSDRKWKEIKTLFHPSFRSRVNMIRHKTRVREFICYGDTQPAVVISVNPLLVAAYSDEMDAVVLLHFPQTYAEKYGLQKFDRLITVNTYVTPGYSTANDIFFGPDYLHHYVDFFPNIADFLSDETEKIQKHKESIPNSIWRHTAMLGEQYLFRHKGFMRNGFWFL